MLVVMTVRVVLKVLFEKAPPPTCPSDVPASLFICIHGFALEDHIIGAGEKQFCINTNKFSLLSQSSGVSKRGRCLIYFTEVLKFVFFSSARCGVVLFPTVQLSATYKSHGTKTRPPPQLSLLPTSFHWSSAARIKRRYTSFVHSGNCLFGCWPTAFYFIIEKISQKRKLIQMTSRGFERIAILKSQIKI